MTQPLSIIKADTGGFVGHSSVHPEMISEARHACGDDLALVMSHRHGRDATAIHTFAWDVLQATTPSRSACTCTAGQDIL